MTAAHGVHDIVISCIDYRFRPQIAEWIKNSLDDQADLCTIPGAAKALIDEANSDHKLILETIGIAVKLHGVATVHLLNHVDCGAYGGSGKHADSQAEHDFHTGQCSQAAEHIRGHFPALEIKSYVVGFDGVHACDHAQKDSETKQTQVPS